MEPVYSPTSAAFREAAVNLCERAWRYQDDVELADRQVPKVTPDSAK